MNATFQQTMLVLAAVRDMCSNGRLLAVVFPGFPRRIVTENIDEGPVRLQGLL
jgi:hypothetical protein